MDEYVEFNAATQQCSINPNPGASAERHLIVDMFTKNQWSWPRQHWISLDCGPTTAKGAEELWNQIKRDGENDNDRNNAAIRTCDFYPDYKKYEPRARCVGPTSFDGMLVRIAAQACEKAPPINGKKPILSIQRDLNDK
jgi:hypothetical protein